MKKKLAFINQFADGFGACSISSACLFVWYQPECREEVTY